MLCPEVALSWLRHSSSHELLHHVFSGSINLSWIGSQSYWSEWAGWIAGAGGSMECGAGLLSNLLWHPTIGTSDPVDCAPATRKGLQGFDIQNSLQGVVNIPTLRDWERHPSMLRWFSLQGPRVGLVDCEALNLNHPHISSDGGADSTHTQYVHICEHATENGFNHVESLATSRNWRNPRFIFPLSDSFK